MKAACGDPHSIGGLDCPRQNSRFFPTRSNRYVISALLARSDSDSCSVAGDLRGRHRRGVTRAMQSLARRQAGPAAIRPADMARPPALAPSMPLSWRWLVWLSLCEHGPDHAGILGRDGDDRLAEADARLQLGSPATDAVSSCLCVCQY
jgi:hypothetical protein